MFRKHPVLCLSLQSNSPEALAARWAQYLSHLQSGSSELQHVFSCLRTIDATNVRLCPAAAASLFLWFAQEVAVSQYPVM